MEAGSAHGGRGDGAPLLCASQAVAVAKSIRFCSCVISHGLRTVEGAALTALGHKRLVLRQACYHIGWCFRVRLSRVTIVDRVAKFM